MPDKWVSAEKVAAHLGVKQVTVYKWIARKDLPAHKAGRLWRFQLREVDAWLKSGGATPKNRK